MKQRHSIVKKNSSANQRLKPHNRTYTLTSETDSILIDNLNSSTVKILNEAQQVKSKVIEIDSDFQMRQKSYELEKQRKMLQLQQELQMNEKKINNGKPHTNKSQQIQDMIDNYMEASIHSKFGELLLKQDKNNQTKESIKQKKQSKYELQETSNYENNDPEGIATQTMANTKATLEPQKSPLKTSSAYIPIQERVKFIVETKNSKIIELQQQQQQVKEEYYSSLPFRPLSAKSQNIKLTQRDADEFFNNQNKWIEQRNKKLFEQQLKKQNEIPNYSYRPYISPWPIKVCNTKREHSKSFINSFLQSTAQKTDVSPKKSVNQSMIFHTDIRIAKRKEKELQQLKKWM